MPLFKSEKPFVLLNYTPSHGMLLVRGHAKNSLGKELNLDLTFYAVKEINIPTTFWGIEVDYLDKTVDKYTIFSLKCLRKDQCYSIVANHVEYCQNDLGPMCSTIWPSIQYPENEKWRESDNYIYRMIYHPTQDESERTSIIIP